MAVAAPFHMNEVVYFLHLFFYGDTQSDRCFNSAISDVTYGLLRAQLEQAGKMIDANDLFIAAQALTLGHVLVTDNERGYRRVEGLECENWLL